MIWCTCDCDCCPTATYLFSKVPGEGEVRCPSCNRPIFVRAFEPFTEADWYSCNYPGLLLQWQTAPVTVRKKRLFACACARLVWEDLHDPRARRAVEIAELFLEGQATWQQVTEIHQICLNNVSALYLDPVQGRSEHVWELGIVAVQRDPQLSSLAQAIALCAEKRPELSVQVCDLFREVIGNPFRKFELRPDWQAWNEGAIPQLAQRIYDEQIFEDMPILGDALEEAGCAEIETLEHCRYGQSHVRGCWVIDLLLEK